MKSDDLMQIARTCACFNFRRVARSVTNFYSEALAPTGLRSTQFVALLVIALKEDASMSELAETLEVDRTTLTRLLAPLKTRSLIKITAGKDRRVQNIRLTAKGRIALKQALPYWRKAQLKLLDVFGSGNWEKLLTELDRATKLKIS
jgi:DNA-binding MarR family transcriptional regulator